MYQWKFPIKFDTVKSGWPIVYIEGSQVIIVKNIFLSLKIDFVLANSANSDEMLHCAFIRVFTICQSTRLEDPVSKWLKMRNSIELVILMTLQLI